MREEEKAGGVGSSYFNLSLFGLELPPSRDIYLKGERSGRV